MQQDTSVREVPLFSKTWLLAYYIHDVVVMSHSSNDRPKRCAAWFRLVPQYIIYVTCSVLSLWKGKKTSSFQLDDRWYYWENVNMQQNFSQMKCYFLVKSLTMLKRTNMLKTPTANAPYSSKSELWPLSTFATGCPPITVYLDVSSVIDNMLSTLFNTWHINLRLPPDFRSYHMYHISA